MINESREDIEIEFPRFITYEEARDLCRYLSFNLRGSCLIDLEIKRREQFNGKSSENLDNVLISLNDDNLKGYFHRMSPSTGQPFDLIQAGIGARVYKGMKLKGYEGISFSKLPDMARDLVTDIHKGIRDYFLNN